MKKISSIRGGRFCIYWLFISIFVSVFATSIAIVLDPSITLVSVFVIPLILLFITIYFIKNGYLSYLEIDNLKISDKKNSLDWKNVYISVTTAFSSVHGRGPIVIMYIDDHYLSEDEIRSKKYKMFMIVTPMMPQRQECILSKYNKKVKILSNYQDELFEVFLKHNKQFD